MYLKTIFKKHKKLTLFTGIFIIVVIGIAITIHYKRDEDRKILTTYLQNELSLFITPPIIINKEVYDVRNSIVFHKNIQAPDAVSLTVLKIAYYSVLTRLEPLIAIPETNLDSLATSVENLEGLVNNLASYYSPQEEKILKSKFHPTQFLSKLPALEKKRKEVTERPSGQNIKEYDKMLAVVIDVYQNYIKELKQTYDATISKTVVFNYPGGSATIGDYQLFFDSLASSAEENNSKRKNRIACLNGHVKECLSFSDSLKQEVIPVTQDKITLQKSYRVPEYINEHLLISRAHYPVDIYNKNTEEYYKNIPIIVLENSTCFPEIENVYYGINPQKALNGEPANKIVFLNDLHFYDLSLKSTTEQHNTSLFKVIQLKTELPFMYQPLASLYFCPDYGHDLSTVNTILKIRSLLQEHPLFGILQNQKKLAELERHIISEPIVYEDDITHYINSLSALFLNYKETEHPYFNKKDILFVERILLLSKTKTANFDSFLDVLRAGNEPVSTFIQNGSKPRFSDLFLTRSLPSITLLAFNKSFVSTTIFTISEKKDNITSLGLTSYRFDLKNKYPIETIIADMRQAINTRANFYKNN